MNEDKAREAFEARSSNINYERNDYGEYVDVWTEGEWQEFKDGWIAALQWAASQQAAEGEDELQRLRAKVDALTREAWTWSKACESESMRIHGVKDAINKAYGIVSKEHPWTPEHSKNYPQQAANIINAAMTIFAPPSTQGGAE